MWVQVLQSPPGAEGTATECVPSAPDVCPQELWPEVPGPSAQPLVPHPPTPLDVGTSYLSVLHMNVPPSLTQPK